MVTSDPSTVTEPIFAPGAHGAEFPVLGRPLIGGIEAHKSYVNHPGYDIFAFGLGPDEGPQRQCQTQARQGKRVRLTVDPERLHFFDPDSGLSWAGKAALAAA